MSSKEYYKQYNASPAGKARMARFLCTPKRKIYQSNWQDNHKELKKLYDQRYKSNAHKPVRVTVFCQSANCRGTFIRKGYRKFCDECRYAFGYHVKSRWWFKRKAKLQAA